MSATTPAKSKDALSSIDVRLLEESKQTTKEKEKE